MNESLTEKKAIDKYSQLSEEKYLKIPDNEKFNEYKKFKLLNKLLINKEILFDYNKYIKSKILYTNI